MFSESSSCLYILPIFYLMQWWIFCFLLRLFIHFYLVGTLMAYTYLGMMVFHCFNRNTSIPQDMSEIFDLYFTPPINCFTSLLSLVFLLMQTSRRLIESLFISIFTGKMNVAHYLLGVTYYILVSTALAAPFFQSSKSDEGKDNKGFYFYRGHKRRLKNAWDANCW